MSDENISKCGLCYSVTILLSNDGLCRSCTSIEALEDKIIDLNRRIEALEPRNKITIVNEDTGEVKELMSKCYTPREPFPPGKVNPNFPVCCRL